MKLVIGHHEITAMRFVNAPLLSKNDPPNVICEAEYMENDIGRRQYGRGTSPTEAFNNLYSAVVSTFTKIT